MVSRSVTNQPRYRPNTRWVGPESTAASTSGDRPSPPSAIMGSRVSAPSLQPPSREALAAVASSPMSGKNLRVISFAQSEDPGVRLRAACPLARNAPKMSTPRVPS